MYYYRVTFILHKNGNIVDTKTCGIRCDHEPTHDEILWELKENQAGPASKYDNIVISLQEPIDEATFNHFYGPEKDQAEA